MTVLLVAVGAAVGAPLRYWTDRIVRAHHDTVYPWGTLAVNLVASLILGGLSGAATHISAEMATLIGTGFCGTLSTYSTFSYENQQLLIDGARFYAAVNVTLSVVAGVGAAALGWSLGASLS
jgi:CrcB protein